MTGLPALPLFHRIAGQPVIVLGHGEAAVAKRRLVERAGGQVVDDLALGIDTGARIAFIAHEDEAALAADALRARCAGLLVNVVDRPDLCDFTTPSLIDRAPVVIAVPSDMAKVAATPARNTPCASENTSTRMAPEQGREPAAITVAAAPRHEKPSPSLRGSGAWSWPHSASSRMPTPGISTRKFAPASAAGPGRQGAPA